MRKQSLLLVACLIGVTACSEGGAKPATVDPSPDLSSPASDGVGTTAEGSSVLTDDLIAYTVYRDGSSEIYAMNSDGTGQTNLTQHSAADLDPAWSPDGMSIVFVSDRDGTNDVFVMDPNGGNPRRLTTGLYAANPAMSPDGRQIAFSSSISGAPTIWMVSTDGGEPEQVSGENGNYPAWSPDGSRLAFGCICGNDFFQIATMATNGSDLAVLTGATDSVGPVWSPDGTRIAYAALNGPAPDIYTMNADGSEQTRLTTLEGWDTSPTWSPDGTKIAFMSSRDGNNDDLYVMNADGTAPIRLTETTDIEAQPDWRRLPGTGTSTSPPSTSAPSISSPTTDSAAPPVLDTLRVFEVVSVDVDGLTMIIREWNPPGPNPSESPSSGTYMYLFGDPASWTVSDVHTVVLADAFTYQRSDGLTTSLAQFGDWANNAQPGGRTTVFWLAQRDGVVTAAAVAWDVAGDGECVEPFDLEPLNDDCQ